MNTAAAHITTVLNSDSELLALLGTNKIHWEFAPDEIELPICNFSIVKAPGPTKNSLGSYTVEVSVYHNTLKEGGVIAQKIEELGVGSSWRYISTSCQYSSVEPKEAFLNITFTFKL